MERTLSDQAHDQAAEGGPHQTSAPEPQNPNETRSTTSAETSDSAEAAETTEIVGDLFSPCQTCGVREIRVVSGHPICASCGASKEASRG